jgi:hypothetical protein
MDKFYRLAWYDHNRSTVSVTTFYTYPVTTPSIAKAKAHGRPKTAALKAERIKNMDKKGYNKSQIAKELGICRTSVRRMLNE